MAADTIEQREIILWKDCWLVVEDLCVFCIRLTASLLTTTTTTTTYSKEIRILVESITSPPPSFQLANNNKILSPSLLLLLLPTEQLLKNVIKDWIFSSFIYPPHLSVGKKKNWRRRRRRKIPLAVACREWLVCQSSTNQTLSRGGVYVRRFWLRSAAQRSAAQKGIDSA